MRIKNSVINVIWNCICYFVLMLTSFFLRQAFVRILDLNLVGIDGIFTNIISILSVVELGLGISISYKIYKPIAQKDWQKVADILNFIKKIYLVISVLMFFLGVIISFFVANVSTINIVFSKIWIIKIFVLYVLDVISSYLFFHRRIMFISDQKSYINSIVRSIVLVIFFCFQILNLIYFQSFKNYLFLKICARITENLIIYVFFDKYYKNINLKHAMKFSENEKLEIINDMKAMFFHRIGGACIRQISSLVVFLLLPLRVNGVYSNYVLIITALLGISNEFFNGISASFGNLAHTENTKKIHDNFNILYFINYIVYSLMVTIFFEIVNPFMKIWIAKENVIFSTGTIIIISIYLYLCGMKQCLDMAKASCGIYVQDRFFPIIETVINFGFSYILTKIYGISGVFLGNILSLLLVPFVTQPYFVYKIIFKKKSVDYYKRYIIYIISFISCLFLSNCIISFLRFSSWMQIFVNILVCLIVNLGVNLILFKKTREFKKIMELVVILKKACNNNFVW
ncbi:MAG: oligosaccharide flippase family protein [Candidatus Improbicoccus devescovinae]|nr:MAG: oligosaccharide flippase family protein [Candidatus Improbicoccus devescovinae]